MCGRVRCSFANCNAAAQALGIPPSNLRHAEHYYGPNHNLHPGQSSFVIVRRSTTSTSLSRSSRAQGAASSSPPSKKQKKTKKEEAVEGEKEKEVKEGKEGEEKEEDGLDLVVMHWGLVPSWTKPDEKPEYFRAFNARCETVESKPFFKRLVNSKRCIAVVDGFYEWMLDPKTKQKQPYYIHWEDNRPLKMAALYDQWYRYKQSPEGQKTEEKEEHPTFAIITKDNSPNIAWLHDRMPVILRNEEEEEKWLNMDKHKMDEILPSISENEDIPGLVWHPVSRKMNNMKYHGEDAADEIQLEPTTTIKSFFSPHKTAASSTSSSTGGSSKDKASPAKKEKKEEAATPPPTSSPSKRGRSASTSSSNGDGEEGGGSAGKKQKGMTDFFKPK